MGLSDLTKIKYLACIFILFLMFVLLRMYRNSSLQREEKDNLYSAAMTPNETGKTPRLILFYNTLWGNRLWPGFETTERFNNWGGKPCKVQNCRVTYNRKMISKADVVIFHAFGGDMLPQRQILKVSKQRKPGSYWIYFLHESPQNARPDPSLYDGLFNWTMGYRRDADIVVPYNWEWGTWRKRTPDDPPVRFRNHAEDKDKLMWGGISHCGCMREHYIHKLTEYINIDLYGQCAKKFYKNLPPNCPRGSAECNKRLKKYKFYLALENSFCEDYTSEKFTETVLDGHTVPIVMGGADYKKLGLPNSFINVNDFDTIEDLANYVKYLDENDDAYNKHFEYKKNYILGEPQSWSCKICEMINSDDLEPKTYPNLGDWYSIKNNCGTRLERLREIMHRSGVPHPYTDEYYLYDYEFD